jgi:hypothetical protein
MNAAGRELARRNAQRFALVGPYLAEGECLLDSGPARYEAAEGVAPGLGEGSIVITDRQMIFRGDRTDQVLAIPYTAISGMQVRRRILTTNLSFTVRDEQFTFNGSKTFFAGLLNEWQRRR